jgi:hypothetical protein
MITHHAEGGGVGERGGVRLWVLVELLTVTIAGNDNHAVDGGHGGVWIRKIEEWEAWLGQDEDER